VSPILFWQKNRTTIDTEVEESLMATRYFLGLDEGTTGTTALIFNEKWDIAGYGYSEHKQIFPKPGWVEHSPLDIWKSALNSTIQACKSAGIEPSDIYYIGIDNEGESVMMWDKDSGEPVYNAIVWQDRRTAEEAGIIFEQRGGEIYYKTGLRVDAYYSATKIKWIIDNVPGVQHKIDHNKILVGTMDSWLIWKMTNGQVHITDSSTASRTMLMNIHTGDWDQVILDSFGFERKMFPTICDSSMIYGFTEPSSFLGVKIPIAGSVADQQAALFGQECFTPGSIKCTYGTGCFMLMNIGTKPLLPNNGALTTVAWKLNGNMTFALDCGVYVAGAAIQWLRDKLHIIDNAAQTEEMAFAADNNGGVFFVPAFTGLAVPYWDSYARGTIVGITGGTSREQIVRATLEATAYQVKDIFDIMRPNCGQPIRAMRVDGGLTMNKFLMQFQADMLGIRIEVPKIKETTALGSARLAALSMGEFSSINNIPQNNNIEIIYEPHMNNDERNSLMHQWHKAIDRSKEWIDK